MPSTTSNSLIRKQALTQVSGSPAGTSLYWNEGMDYIAYYPYKEGVTIDTGKTTDEIMTSLVETKS